MDELIAIGISKGGKRTVNARDLHEFLESKQQFANWIRNRIDQYDFIENQDYCTINKIINRQTLKEYHITLDMAKELSMVERNEKGKQARKYFIECERRLKSYAPALPSYQEALRQLADSIDAKEKAEEKLKLAAPKVEFHDAVSDTDSCILVGDLAKLLTQNGYKIGQNRLFEWLRESGYLLSRPGSKNRPSQWAMEQDLFRVIERVINTPSGTELTITPKVTGKGQQHFINLFLSLTR